MEFLLFLEAIFTFCDPAMQYAGLNVLPVWTAFAIAGGLYAVVYVFKAIGLLVMAKKQGKTKLAWCAFIPFASTFLLGELAGELRFGSVKVKHLGIIAMVMELIYTFSGVFVIGWQANLISGGSYIVERVLNNAGDVIGYTTVFEGVSQQLQTLLNVFSVIELVFRFVQLIAFIFLNIAFFRRYAPLSYIWMVLFCAILPPVEAFLVFAYRNRKPIDFDAYMKERAERIRRAQQAQFGPMGKTRTDRTLTVRTRTGRTRTRTRLPSRMTRSESFPPRARSSLRRVRTAMRTAVRTRTATISFREPQTAASDRAAPRGEPPAFSLRRSDVRGLH